VSEARTDRLTLTPLLHKRVLFFVGKGGVGKTTVAAAFALAAARQKKKTLLIEIGENSRTARLLGLPSLDNPINILQEVSSTLSVLSISGAAALEEYLHLIIPVKRLVRLFTKSRPYQYFVAAAPGLKELLTIGKVWYEERRRDTITQQSRWDVLVVDLPATGHGLQYLNMPCAARDTFGDGLVHREAERIATWLQDSDKSAVNLVTTAEELPVSETFDAYHQLNEKLQLPLGALFVNQVCEIPPLRVPLSRLKVNTEGSLDDQHLAEQVLACAQIEVAIAEAQKAYLQQLQRLPLPLLSLPLSISSEFGPVQLEALSHRIETALNPVIKKAARRRQQ
jgi:anion-transporting  ArsA/GET3 family ATPase